MGGLAKQGWGPTSVSWGAVTGFCESLQNDLIHLWDMKVDRAVISQMRGQGPQKAEDLSDKCEHISHEVPLESQFHSKVHPASRRKHSNVSAEG